METDWLWGLIGGLMIGCAGAVLLLGNGRIMGASGILSGLMDRGTGHLWTERLAFVIGLIALPAVLQATAILPQVATNLTGNLFLVGGAGLLVGLGTRIGNGCTSGHGVCGISRFSLRGMTSTVVYIGAGVVMVAVLRSLLGMLP